MYLKFQVHGKNSVTSGFNKDFSVNLLYLITECTCFSKYEALPLNLGNSEVFNPSL